MHVKMMGRKGAVLLPSSLSTFAPCTLLFPYPQPLSDTKISKQSRLEHTITDKCFKKASARVSLFMFVDMVLFRSVIQVHLQILPAGCLRKLIVAVFTETFLMVPHCTFSNTGRHFRRLPLKTHRKNSYPPSVNPPLMFLN